MKNKKILVIIAVLLGLVIIGAILEKTHVINLYHKAPKTSAPSQGPTAQQKQQEDQTNADAKQQAVNDKATDTGSATTTPATTSITLTAQQESNNTVTVFTKLPGYSDGTCELITTNGTRINSQTANVIYQPEFSSCAGFSVPITALGKGTWTLKLSVTSKGTTESKTISYEVK